MVIICPFNRKIILVRSYKTKSKYNQKGWGWWFTFMNIVLYMNVKTAQVVLIWKNTVKLCSCATIHDIVTKFKYESNNEFADGNL